MDLKSNLRALSYQEARFYDSDVARFLSLDPHAHRYPSFSDYSYVAGNPILFIDPDGEAVTPTNKSGYTRLESYIDSYSYTDKKGNVVSGSDLFGLTTNDNRSYTTDLRYSAKKMRKKLTKAGFSSEKIESGMNFYGALLTDDEVELVGIEKGMKLDEFYNGGATGNTINPDQMELFKENSAELINAIGTFDYLDKGNFNQVAKRMGKSMVNENYFFVPNETGRQVKDHYSLGFYIITEEMTIENAINKGYTSTDQNINKRVKELKKEKK